MYEAKRMSCCGISEVKGICGSSFSAEGLFKWLTEKYHYTSRANGNKHQRAGAGRGLYVFTLVHSKPADPFAGRLTKTACDQREKEFRKYINDNGLGELITLPEVGNPNYNNLHTIRTLVYVPNQEALLDFCIEKGWAKKEPDAYLDYWIEGA